MVSSLQSWDMFRHLLCAKGSSRCQVSRCVTLMDGRECNIVTVIDLSTIFELLSVRHGARHWGYGDEQGNVVPAFMVTVEDLTGQKTGNLENTPK